MLNDATLQRLYELYLKAGQAVCTDTRKIEKDSLFFALRGPNFNANELAQKAIAGGCSAAVIDDEKFSSVANTLLVPDCLKALQQLASYHRSKFSIPFLAITGSNGKTTNKELINAVLSTQYSTLATIGNLNNHIGVPLTLLRLRKEHTFAIIEMGANHQGEIDELCRIADPGYGLITNVGKAHLEGFGGFEGVKKGKSELYRYIAAKGGKVFVNGDDDELHTLAESNDKITYGFKKLYDVIGKDCGSTETVKFKYTTRYGERDFGKIGAVNTSILGSYNLINCLAAACVGVYFKVEPGNIKKALEDYRPEMNRSQLVRTKNNVIILDAYNANPNSMKAAIENFAKHPAEKKMIMLGDMFELGEYSRSEHEAVVDLLKKQGFHDVLLVGDEFGGVQANGFKKFSSTEDCRKYLSQSPPSGKTILIKGSRGMKMETLAELL
jgi:UDP-N-acetylmuramoyl-tripeptide--D-alanyl-D-alanine ligase